MVFLLFLQCPWSQLHLHTIYFDLHSFRPSVSFHSPSLWLHLQRYLQLIQIFVLELLPSLKHQNLPTHTLFHFSYSKDLLAVRKLRQVAKNLLLGFVALQLN